MLRQALPAQCEMAERQSYQVAGEESGTFNKPKRQIFSSEVGGPNEGSNNSEVSRKRSPAGCLCCSVTKRAEVWKGFMRGVLVTFLKAECLHGPRAAALGQILVVVLSTAGGQI